MLQSKDNPQRVEYEVAHYVAFWNWVRTNFESRGVKFKGVWAR